MSVEPNDTISEANDSGVSSTGNLSTIINSSLSPEDDVDLYRFQADEGLGITLDIDSNEFNSGLDPILRLFDAQGNELAVSDDDPAPGENSSLDSYIGLVADFTGDYYVGVSSFSNFNYDPVNGSDNSDSGGSSGDYDLEIGLVEVEPDDDPDNTISEAIATGLDDLGESGTFSDEIDTQADVDIYQFQLDAGEGVTLDIDANEFGSGLDSLLRLFDAEGNELALSDSDPAPDEDFSGDSFISFIAETSGDYYVGVSSSGNFDYDSINGRTNLSQSNGFSSGNYDLNINILEVGPDDDPDNTISEAVDSGISSAGQNSTVIQEEINPQADVDVFEFQLAEGDTVNLNINAAQLNSGLDPILRLFDAEGNELAVSDDDPAPGEDFSLDSFIEFTASTSGSYYVGVSSFSNFGYDVVNGRTNIDSDNNSSSTGDYDLAIDVFDNIEGTRGDDALVGDSGNNLIRGLGGNDIITGRGQNDRLIGNGGTDLLSGNGGDDTLTGDNGADSLFGGPGDDVLQGGSGDNFLSGDTGADIFVLEDNGGTDTIFDFENGVDKILIQNGFSFFDLTIESADSGFSASIAQFGNTLATITGIDPSVLTEDDFIFN